MSASIGNNFIWRLSRASHLRFAQTALGMTISSRQSLIWTLTPALIVIEDYRAEYNTFRPHSKLCYLTFHLRGNERPPHLYFRLAYGFPTPGMDNNTSTHYNHNQPSKG